jgi:hypothetical protein
MSVVLKAISLQWTLRSRLILPNGQVSFPAADLLPMTIITEELTFDRARRPLVLDHGRKMARKTYIASSASISDFTPG